MTNIYDEYDIRTRDAWKGKREVVKDKEHVVVPMNLMDDKSKATKPPPIPFYYADARPRSTIISDEERTKRQKLYQDHNDKLSNAWKGGNDSVEGDAG